MIDRKAQQAVADTLQCIETEDFTCFEKAGTLIQAFLAALPPEQEVSEEDALQTIQDALSVASFELGKIRDEGNEMPPLQQVEYRARRVSQWLRKKGFRVVKGGSGV